ncbi:MAG TPA: pantoate--beta-alanine ligase [Flavobacteriales bacterium]|jgi:pantoate--beta-alanine ligase|nr:pantoate--beta-alanine ligase [Flavobacteriales bacterium]
MKIIRTPVDLKDWFNEHKVEETNFLGFVPTMGALHSGHASLIEMAAHECNKVIVSILVNPTQFNEKNDLASYPRTLVADAKIAEQAGCDVVFAPTAEDLYGGTPFAEHIDWGGVTNDFEGKSRPGHFDGVIAVVDKLFQAVRPNRAYFGAKDLQQVAVIHKMAQERHKEVQVVECALIRDHNGLALSSRNVRLSQKGLKTALILSSELRRIKEKRINGTSIRQAIIESRELLKSQSELELEYIDGINNLTFSSHDHESVWTHIVIAARVEGVRLIDNIKL